MANGLKMGSDRIRFGSSHPYPCPSKDLVQIKLGLPGLGHKDRGVQEGQTNIDPTLIPQNRSTSDLGVATRDPTALQCTMRQPTILNDDEDEPLISEPRKKQRSLLKKSHSEFVEPPTQIPCPSAPTTARLPSTVTMADMATTKEEERADIETAKSLHDEPVFDWDNVVVNDIEKQMDLDEAI